VYAGNQKCMFCAVQLLSIYFTHEHVNFFNLFLSVPIIFWYCMESLDGVCVWCSNGEIWFTLAAGSMQWPVGFGLS